jgi:hypothetical protein
MTNHQPRLNQKKVDLIEQQAVQPAYLLDQKNIIGTDIQNQMK